MQIRRKRMISTSVQFDDKQFFQLDQILSLGNFTSYASIIRDSFDFYVENKYPELLELGELEK